jgi:hypothetical protein
MSEKFHTVEAKTKLPNSQAAEVQLKTTRDDEGVQTASSVTFVE